MVVPERASRTEAVPAVSTGTPPGVVCDARSGDADAVICFRCAARRFHADGSARTEVRVVPVRGGVEIRIFVPDDDPGRGAG